MQLRGKTITLVITGSIAAYKCCELVRTLKKQGANVFVVLSESAQAFVTPLTLQTLSGNLVRTSFFETTQEASIDHIELADAADVVLVAPATANFIAQAALGLSGDLPSAVLLATQAPVVIAPAMNVNMWKHEATQRNVSILKARGIDVMEPESGALACGWEGDGRLPEIDRIAQRVAAATFSGPWKDIDVVITAGPTREYFDPIRFLSNGSSGRMGYALAREASRLGARTVLISGPVTQTVPPGVELQSVVSASQMQEAVFETLMRRREPGRKQLCIMTAAVSDQRPQALSPEKLKFDKEQLVEITLVPNPDILKALTQRRREIESASGGRLFVVGFAAESGTREDVLRYASEKFERKGVDLLAANNIAEGFGGDENRILLIGPRGLEAESELSSKDRIAKWLLNEIDSRLLRGKLCIVSKQQNS